MLKTFFSFLQDTAFVAFNFSSKVKGCVAFGRTRGCESISNLSALLYLPRDRGEAEEMSEGLKYERRAGVRRECSHSFSRNKKHKHFMDDGAAVNTVMT